MKPEKDYWEIEAYLRDPEGGKECFWMGPAVFWIDWREYDEDIARAVSESLPPEDAFSFAVRDSVLPRGIDILLDGEPIPYAPDRLDRDTTLKAVQARLAPDYQLRFWVPSAGGDILGFCLLSAESWRRLEEEFGVRAVARCFQPIGENSRLFG